MEFIPRITLFPVIKPYMCNLNCMKIYVFEWVFSYFVAWFFMKTGRNELNECYAGFYMWCSWNIIVRKRLLFIAFAFTVYWRRHQSKNWYENVYSITCQPVHSCKIIWKSSAAFLDGPCTCVLLKLLFSGFLFFCGQRCLSSGTAQSLAGLM